MHYGDEYGVVLPDDLDTESLSPEALRLLFRHAKRLTSFASSADRSFTHEHPLSRFPGLRCFRLDAERMIEINDVDLENALVIRNQVADLISFQFVSNVKRSELLGKRRNVHDLGPALIVSAVPQREMTYRMPKAGESIRHVVVHTSLSQVLKRLHEEPEYYPQWLLDLTQGRERKALQRVFFLEDIYREPIWSCFHLPVSGSLLGPWMSAKFDELLCMGLQILKNSQAVSDHRPLDLDLPQAEKIRRARNVLSSEYTHPPSLPQLALRLGISETQLKSGFRAMYGTSVMQYCIAQRIEAAKLLLKDGHHSISEIGDMVGYEDHSAFSRAFRRLSGCTPQEWRRTWHQ